MKLPRVFALATAAAQALLAGCVHGRVGPDYAAPAPLTAAQAASNGPFVSGGGATSDATMPPLWWRLFEEPQLDSLIAQAFEHNTDLRQALATLERATAVEAEVHGTEQPSITLNGGPSFGHVSGLSPLQRDQAPPSRIGYSMGAAVSYQVDLFGQLRRAIEAAEADTGTAGAAVDLVRVTVAGKAAQTYAAACSSGLQLRVARESVRLQEEALELAQRLHRAGRAGPIDAVRALELIELLHKRAVNELVIVEVGPARYQVHPIVAWRIGRSVLLGSGGQPRTFRSLDTLATHLKTLGIGRTVVRIELLG